MALKYSDIAKLPHSNKKPKHPVKVAVEAKHPEPKAITKDQIDKLIVKYSDQDAKAHAKALADSVVPDVFLKLSRRRSDRNAFVDLFIRPEAIESICTGVDGYAILNGNRYYSVRETAEEIFRMVEGAKR